MNIMNYFLQTFGCQMNYADSEKINMVLLQSGFKKVSSLKDADLVIFNTCSVRKKGEDKVFGMINDLRKEEKITGKKMIIGISGCMVRKTGLNQKLYDFKGDREATKNIEFLDSNESVLNSDDKIFGRTDKIDFVFRIEEINFLTKLLSIIFKKDIGNDEKFNEYLQIRQYQENVGSANVIIQTGCDNFCTYCIVPHTRGREKSREKIDILDEIREVAVNGTKEVYLIGQNVNSYGKEFNAKLWNMGELRWNPKSTITPFRELLNEVNKIDGIDRIRFTSSNPHDMTKDILDSHFELDKTCNYLHFALQSGDNDILKSMNRKHTYEDFKAQVEYLRSKDPLFSISTDIIVGFPGETEEQFQNTVNAFKELEFDFAFIARYSERSGTIAATNFKDNVSSQEKARRWHILNLLLAESVEKRSKPMIGRTEEILISGVGKSGNFYGRTRNFKEVSFPSDDDSLKIGDMVNVTIEKLDGWIFRGTISR
ncbi:MAG: MiaB/RimO family radical SAM methylthiotransferase [Candidatus Gracilibacteria bacterium]|nr:MiaB/RimO family radical SAM methylthiotransferase [Candidatus Gracilibacteria bacterium]